MAPGVDIFETLSAQKDNGPGHSGKQYNAVSRHLRHSDVHNGMHSVHFGFIHTRVTCKREKLVRSSGGQVWF